MKPVLAKRWNALVLLAPFILGCVTAVAVSGKVGADQPWTTIEVEDMRITGGTILGPQYAPHLLESESSGRKCVQLKHPGELVEFTAAGSYDSLVIRFNLPDAPAGGGTTSELALRINGQVVQTVSLNSHYMWLYGAYPFSNDPKQGETRNFYDELRLKHLKIAAGDVVRLEKTSDDGITCTLDLVDLELMPAPVAAPAHSVSALDFGADPLGKADSTEALRRAITAAQKQGGIVWVPAGDYLITGDTIVPSGITIQGAGMWHTTFWGDPAVYGDATRRVRFKLKGTNMHLADFAIVGRLNYRNDQEENDGVIGSNCTDASVTRVWVEHTKAGAWIYNGTRLVLDSCRFRNLLADGVNFCVGTNHSVIENCTARGAGDDCFAIWPVASDQGYDEHAEKPGNNVIRNSTGSLPFLANGGSLYGGAGNRLENCLFTDIPTGCGILISTTFPTSDEARKVDNNFSGTTVVKNNRLIRCGGYDHVWGYRGSIQLCLDRRSISGVHISQLEILDSVSEGLTVVAPGSAKGEGTLSDTLLEDIVVTNPGIGTASRGGLWVRNDANGGLKLLRSKLVDVRNDSDNFKISKE